jgi:cholest-4-en-3-one 26-monooxygenase
MTSKLSLETIDIISDQTFADNGYPHEAWALLRREAPIFWYDREDVRPPFWAVTKHEDLVRISKNPQIFRNAPRLAVFPEFDRDEGDYPARHLLNMDPPEHAKYRRIVSSHFTPRAVERMKRGVDDITDELLDGIMGSGDTIEGDFVQLFSARLPLAVLADLLGVPRAA